MKAADFEKLFDDGQEDIVDHLDFSTLRKPNIQQRRINLDIPQAILAGLDVEAKRIGITRQALIKVWLCERLDSLHNNAHT